MTGCPGPELMEVRIRLFGAFRDLGVEPEIRVRVAPRSTLAEVRGALGRQLAAAWRQGANTDTRELETLIRQSALADESRVLQDSEPVSAGMRLAILPPVCGG